LIEVGSSDIKVSKLNKEILQVEYRESDTAWFKESFIMAEQHYTFVGRDKHIGPFVVSVVREPAKNGSHILRVLLRTKKEDIIECIVENTKKSKAKKKPSIDAVLKVINPDIGRQNIRRVKESRITQDLLQFEERQIMKQFKIGVLYCREGQSDEREMFSNEQPSDEFKTFLKLIGRKVSLKGFAGFSGGLDTSSLVATGTHSVYNEWRGYEIMFHVSTYLPFAIDDAQQLQRKRHLGNDIVLIVFKEGNLPYAPDSVTSTFNHVIIVVQPVPYKNTTWYRLSVARKDSVPSFGPELPEPALFPPDHILAEFLLTKAINGERASYRSSIFATKLLETRLGMLLNIEQNYLTS